MFRIPDTAQLLKNSRRTGVAVAACLSAAALVAGCGGGDRVKPFQPQQIIAFGDENSAFETTSLSPAAEVTSIGTMKGLTYTINLVVKEAAYCQSLSTSALCTPPVATGTGFAPVGSPAYTRSSAFPSGVDDRKMIEIQPGNWSVALATPTLTPIDLQTSRSYFCTPVASTYAGNWVQLLASTLGSNLSFGGDYCSQDTGNAQSYAHWGAMVDDVRTQFNTHRGELRDGVLVAMLAGQNDIMSAYDTYRSTNKEAGLALMRQKGAQLGAIINDIVATGARVVYLTVPNMGLAPAAVADPTYARDLTIAFNSGDLRSGGLELAVKTDGHKIVKVDSYTQINNIAPSVAATAACSTVTTDVKMPDGVTTIAAAAITGGWSAATTARALLLNCTSDNLVTGATLTSSLWADDKHLSPVGHNGLAVLAIARVRDQL